MEGRVKVNNMVACVKHEGSQWLPYLCGTRHSMSVGLAHQPLSAAGRLHHCLWCRHPAAERGWCARLYYVCM